MSVQLKNAGRFKSLFLLHGEKLGVALVAVLAGWLVYKSTEREPETRKPDDLRSLVSRASDKIDSFTWDVALTSADPKPRLAEEFQPAAEEKIEPGPYAMSRQGLNRAPVPPVVLRKDPVLLPAIDVEGHGYTLLMGFYSDAKAKEIERERLAEEQRREKDRERERERSERAANNNRRNNRNNMDGRLGEEDDPNKRAINAPRSRGGISLSGEELIKVQPCAVVLAKVPVQDQLKIFQDTFENARGYNASRDVPKYLGYFVERAEVRQDQPLEWKPARLRNGLGGRPLPAVTSQTLDAAVADWLGEAEIMVDGRYFYPTLTMPLPALIGKDWGTEVVHSDMPLEAETEALEADAENESEVMDPNNNEGGNIFGFDPNDARGGRSGRGEMGMRGGRSRGAMGMGMGRGMSRGMGDEMGMGMGRGGSRGRGRSGSDEFGFDAPYVMTRFIDFDVRPGYRYRYRFQLVLLDVNGKGQTRGVHLDKEVLQRVSATKPTATPIVRSEWSEPSAPISIPLAGNVLIAGAARSSTSGTTANVVVQSFDIGEDDKAMEAALEKEKVRPGSIMNMLEKDVWIAKGRFLEKVETFKFRTGITLLDIEGGRKLSKKMVAPARVLTMDATGRLAVRSQLEDASAVEAHRELYSEDEDSRGRGGGGGGGMDMMRDMGFGEL